MVCDFEGVVTVHNFRPEYAYTSPGSYWTSKDALETPSRLRCFSPVPVAFAHLQTLDSIKSSTRQIRLECVEICDEAFPPWAGPPDAGQGQRV